MLSPDELPDVDFTDREIEIIQLCKQNFSCKEIADRLFISEKTVRKHRQNILAKVGGNGRKDFRDFIRNCFNHK